MIQREDDRQSHCHYSVLITAMCQALGYLTLRELELVESGELVISQPWLFPWYHLLPSQL